MNKFISLIFYILMFCISSIIITYVGNLYKKGNTKKDKILILTSLGIAIPFLIAALRYRVGTDYNNYISIYNQYKGYSIIEILKNEKEFFFYFIIKIAYWLNNKQFMFGIISFLTIIVMYKSIFDNKEKCSLGFMFFLYLFLHFTVSFNIIRQGLAIVIIAYSYKFIFNKDIKHFTITVIIASMFHISALLFLPFYCINLNNKKIRNIIYLAIIIILIIIILNYNTFLNILTNINGFEKFERYTSINIGKNREIIISTIILAIILLFKKPLEQYNPKNKIYIFFLIINWILLLTGFISPFIKRSALYFGISNVYLLPSFPMIVKTKEQKVFITFIIILYAITIFVLSQYVFAQGNVLPYQTIFKIKN